MRISDWNSDVCSSDLDDVERSVHAPAAGELADRLHLALTPGNGDGTVLLGLLHGLGLHVGGDDRRTGQGGEDLHGDLAEAAEPDDEGESAAAGQVELGRASCWERGCQYV